jgi:hypothetical protein
MTQAPTRNRYRLVSYHPTWGEDWSHYDTYIDAVIARARKLAHSPEIHYRIVDLYPPSQPIQ